MGNSESDQRLGTVLDGRYRLEARLASGGFGAVYRATHLPTGCDVAIKVLHSEYADDPAVITRFAREAETLARLRHQHTVTTYELGTTREGTHYIAMELLRGESLIARLERIGRFDWREVLPIARAICEALAEAHALGIVHRDLKPANIHLEPWAEGRELVKVIDFGIAKILQLDGDEELTSVGQVLGTIEYMAPEQLTGGTVDCRADQYALGVMLYELIAGTRPFEKECSPVKLVTAMLTQTPVAPAASIGIQHPGAAQLDAVLLRCLAPSASDRYATVGELIAALDAILTSDPATRNRWAIDTATVIIPEGDEVTWIHGKAPSCVCTSLAAAARPTVRAPLVTLPGRPGMQVLRAARGSEMSLPTTPSPRLPMNLAPVPCVAPVTVAPPGLWVRVAGATLVATGVAIGVAVASLLS